MFQNRPTAQSMPGQLPFPQTPFPQTTADGAPVVVRRSARRRRTVTAWWEQGAVVVAIPGHFTAAEEREWVAKMVAKLQSKGRRPGARAPGRTDAELMERARELSHRYLDGRARPETVRWVRNQNSRWGSATPARGSIRLSDKLKGMPEWVVDYVLLHELAHLLEASHNARFWGLLEVYPDLARAKAFLQGVSFAGSRGLDRDGYGADDDGDVEEADDGDEDGVGEADGNGDDDEVDGLVRT